MAWFDGQWPTFHDAEVLSIHLNRHEASTIRIHTWRNTRRVGAEGYFICDKHVIVTFVLDGVQDIELAGFNHQNVLTSLAIEAVDDGIRILLAGIFGVDGTLIAKSLRIELEPGQPPR
jgi:hypothetical protein